MKKQKIFTIINAAICSIMILTLLAGLILTASYWYAASLVLVLMIFELILSPLFFILDIIGIFVSKNKIRIWNIVFLILNIFAAAVFCFALGTSIG